MVSWESIIYLVDYKTGHELLPGLILAVSENGRMCLHII